MQKILYTQSQLFFDAIFLKPSIVLGILFLSFSFFIFGGCGRETSKEDLGLINGRLEQLENKITQLEAQFTETNESVTTLGSYVIALEEKIAKLNQEAEKTSVPKQTILQEKKQYHKVVRGDTLYSISRRYGLSVEEIRRLNNLNDNKPIQPGQKLMVVSDSHK